MHTSLGSCSRDVRAVGKQSSSYRHLPASAVPRPLHSRPHRVQRVQVATTETVTQAGAQLKSSWSPWKVLSPFGNKQKRQQQQQQQQQQQLQTISEAELWNMLEAEQEVPLVVIFSATWCGPCKIMVQRIESLMKDLGPQGIKAVKVDTDTCPELASQLKVHKLPTMFFVGPHSSKPAAHYTGLMPESVIQDMVENRSKFLGTDIRKAVSI